MDERKPPPGIKASQERGPDGKIRRKGAAPPEADDVDLYAAMKHVLAGASCVSPLQRSCRDWLKEKTSAFMDRFAVLEAAKLGSEAKKDEPDQGHDAAMQVAVQWLRENGAKPDTL